jgi:carbamoyl-phosphate synthase small subunit
MTVSNWRSEQSLEDFLKASHVVAIAEIDTRKLTQLLRDSGPQNGCILSGAILAEKGEQYAIEQARAFPGLKGMDLAKEVTVKAPYHWRQGEWKWGEGYSDVDHANPFHVVAYDYGVKRNILRMLAQRNCKVTVVPAQTPASVVLAMNPDGVFLSNGPGDPEPCDYAIAAIRQVLATDIPVFGICLGCQLLALACGARTVKMRLGHHGANHPVQNLDDNTVMITSQNHGFAVDEASLPDNLRATHRSLFDGSLQGIERTDKSAFAFQGHPEASPGPHDIAPLFDKFIDLMAKRSPR